MSQVHIVGAGMAGLASAVSLVKKGYSVALYESGIRAGGRCRSFFDTRLGCMIDNGNHLLLSGNLSAMRYLLDIGASDQLTSPPQAAFLFVDIPSGQRWCLRPNHGMVPWWVLRKNRRVPGTRAINYLSALRLLFAGNRTVTECLGDNSILFERFWEPLAVGVLNTPAEKGAASLLWPVLRETFGKGEAFCRPRIAKKGLSAAFVDPAVRFLERHGVAVQCNQRLRHVAFAGSVASELNISGRRIAIKPDEKVVLALPSWTLPSLLPSLTAPLKTYPIVNVHFRLPVPADLPAGAAFLGLVRGTAQWVFVRGDVLSVTVSAADTLAQKTAEVIAQKTWADVSMALDRRSDTMPPYRVVKEKQATFAQTPTEIRRRPKTRTSWNNLYLAGDWVDTGLPATIEGAIRSGYMAAEAVMKG